MNLTDLVEYLVIGYAIGQLIVLLIITFDTWGGWLLHLLHPIAPAWNAIAARRRHP